MPSTFRNAKLYKKSPRGKSTPRTPRSARKSDSKKTPRTFEKRVNAIVAKNIENKFTLTKTYTNHVGTVTATVTPNVYTYDFFTYNPGGQASALTDQLFNIAQGTNQSNRIGNSIKIKRWIMKGVISPNIFGTNAPYSTLGYVDVYFGRTKLNTTQVANTLTGFYQDGAISLTPSMKNTDMLCSINKDLYKVYWHKRFKVGNSGVPANAQAPENNDYGLTHTFGFDVCRYICAHRQLTYLDSGTFPQDADIANLTLWATFTPFTGQVFSTSTAGIKVPTYFQISVVTYAEYEDA